MASSSTPAAGPPAPGRSGSHSRGGGGGRSRGGRGGGGGKGRGGPKDDATANPRGGGSAGDPAKSSNKNDTTDVNSSSGNNNDNNKQPPSQKSRSRGGRGGRSNRTAGGKHQTKQGGGRGSSTSSGSGEQQPQVNPPTNSLEQKQAQEEREIREKKEKAEAAEKAKAEAAAAAAAKKKRLEAEQKCRDAMEVLKSHIETVSWHQKLRDSLQPESLAMSRKDFEANKKQLKTDLKKCTTFVKKVKSGSIYGLKIEDIQKDVATLNLSRYVEEVAAAILESKPKLGDIQVVTELAAAMHMRYDDFLPNLLPALWDYVYTKADNVEVAKTRRLYLRILTVFLLSGLVSEPKPLIKCISEATGSVGGGKGGSISNNNAAVQDPNLVVAFSKAAGSEVFGVTPKSIKEAISTIESLQEEISQGEDVSSGDYSLLAKLLAEGATLTEQVKEALKQRGVDSDVTDVFSKNCFSAYQFLASSLVQTHSKLLKLEKRCENDRLLSGSLTDAREASLAQARKLKENLHKCVETLSDVLDQPMPHLEEGDNDNDHEAGLGVEVWTKGGAEGGGDDFGPFGDEETRDFYCDIPDMLTTIPPALLGMTPEQIEIRKAENLKKYGDSVESEVVEDESSSPEVVPSTEAELEAEEIEAENSENKDTEKAEDSEANKDTPHYRLTVLLDNELPECHRREQVDEIAEKFCQNYGSSSKSRKRLARTLFVLPANRTDLLPFYSRTTAILDRVWPDIATTLVTDLEQQFHGQAKFKKNQNTESRMKTARYIGELTKFRVAPPIVFLRCIRRCLDDFTGANVDVACCLLESCGRFIFRLKHTTAKLASLMDAMTRLSKAKNLDDRLQYLLKGAFHSVNPPPSGPRKQAKQYPPLELFLRHILIVQLDCTVASVVNVSTLLLRLPWSDPAEQCGALVSKLMLKACRRGRYKTIRAIAAIAERLRSRRGAGEVTVRLIDSVLEELRWALEHLNFRDQQRVLTYAILLGELYDARQVSGELILRQLYDFINVGHEIPEALKEASKLLLSTNENALPVYTSTTAVTATINEDEELDEDAIQATTAEAAPVKPKPIAVSEQSKYDPRVPAPLTDPPNSAYRIKLVCTLLEVAAKSLVTRSNLPKLKGFLAAFQRYLFTKTVLPTEVEFALLDTFDIIDSRWRNCVKGNKANINDSDSGFPRYNSWIDAHNATVAYEEAEAIGQSKFLDRHGTPDDELEASSDSEEDDEGSTQTGPSVKESVAEGNDDEGDLGSEQDGERDDGDGQSAAHSENDDEDAENDDYDSDVYTEEEEEFDEEAYMRQLEEEAFERELRQVTMAALEKGKNTARKQVADNMPSGSQILTKKRVAEGSDAAAEVTTLGGEVGISFQLLKRGNKGKVESKELVVPKDNNLAIAASRHDDAAARERDVIKQRVLQYEAESATSGGNVYLEQEKLQVIRNRPLSMEDIDKNFGTSGGNLRQNSSDNKGRQQPMAPSGRVGDGRGRGPEGRGRGVEGRGRGRVAGRGRGRSPGGRTLFRG